MGIEQFWIFLAAGIVLNLTPGADTMYILARSVAEGRRAGAVSALGIGAGSLAHTVAAALGLSAILASSATAFAAVKVAGAVYLVYLGVQLWRAGGRSPGPAAPLAGGAFRQGLVTNLLNPKVALFFLAFLPQFVDPASPARTLAFVTLGVVFTVTGTIWCLVLAWTAGALSARLRAPRTSRYLHRGAGVILTGMGVGLLAEPR